VGEVNAAIDGGDPFVVADAPPRVAGRRLLFEPILPLVLGLAFVAFRLLFALGTDSPFGF
jgi:hypothetical protein